MKTTRKQKHKDIAEHLNRLIDDEIRNALNDQGMNWKNKYDGLKDEILQNDDKEAPCFS